MGRSATYGGDKAENVATLLISDAEAEAATGVLRGAGIGTVSLAPSQIADGIRSGTLDAVVICDSAIASVLDDLEQALSEQPPWSFFPFVVLTQRRGLAPVGADMERLNNIRLVERPLDPVILLAAVGASLRGRQCQREAEARLRERDEAQAKLQELTGSLEASVRNRTEELHAAHEQLLLEMEERRRAQDKLRESEELYRFTVELSGQLVWTASPEGRISYLSPSFSQVTGLDREMDPHEGWLTVIHPDDYEAILATFAETIGRGEPNAAEFRMRLADGSYRTFLARAAPRRDEGGQIVRWYGYTLDVEDQKQAEAARLSAEERYRLAARATNDAIWDLDLESQEIHWSDSAAECLGYPGRELGTTTLAWWEERVHPEDRQQAVESLDQAVERGSRRWSATYRFRRANGNYATFFDRGFIVRGEDGKAARFVGAMTDLSEREKAEEQITRIQAELIHVSRVSAMGTMASTLAHELNQPLTAVTNYVRGSRRLLDGGDPNQLRNVAGALASAEEGALRAGHIVKRLRELVSRGTAAMRPEELPKLIEDAGVIAFLDAEFLGITPVFDLDRRSQWVEADRIQVQQVLINLIRNAVQALQEAERREITISTRRKSRTQVEISVADTGPGISPGVRDALFTAFQGTKAEGMGIGLSISRTIVEAHGGKIWAEDKEGGGTVFRFTLPLWYQQPPREH